MRALRSSSISGCSAGCEAGESLHHDSVIRIEPQLGEGLVVGEGLSNIGIARRSGVQPAERLAGPAAGGRMRAAGE